MTVYAQQTKQRSQFLGEISVCSAIIQLYIICMWITRCNNHDLYNGACGMFGNTGMIIHINATLTCVGLNAFCTHLITCVSGAQNGGGADSLGANPAKPGRHHTTIGGK